MIKKMDNKIQNLGTDKHERFVHIHETEEHYYSGSNHGGSVYGGSSYKGSQRPSVVRKPVKKQHYYKDVEGEMEEAPAQNEQDSREFEDNDE
eukprot:CAMPEP_0176390030 /NCGR_PEP_ID=MMETSP0126-20121128/38846_1 /TAXON_ID=141414 ORGANISM="Strombidinopsis acuminatum, Strain SPMC142" /NCGR_SAMPLE_ID=MMETSP0126 /ASSEMBLY_ACC=CAM_ASM_000229 /LENGTH=91 /DNA_ID=CAMNT_0017759191 /DNA_START=2888 /DNA_END=3163 /DNA_ORIENTATION=-